MYVVVTVASLHVLLQFIKIGQQFSTRVDVLSPEFVKELEKLQVGLLCGGVGGWRGAYELGAGF